MENLIENFEQYYVVIATIIGSAALILTGIQQLFDLKPDSKWNKKLTILINLLDRLALNPDQSKARPCKGDKQDEEGTK